MTSLPSELQPQRVPERHVPAFKALRELGEDQFSDVLSALADADTTASRPVIDESVHAASRLNRSDVSALLDAVIGLAALGYKTRSAAGLVAKRVASSPQFGGADELHERFSGRIERLLEGEFVRLQSKALSIGAAHERVFANAQILTDLRPLFDSDVTENPEPEAALLSHTLILHFIGSNGAHDNFFVALDDDDIEVLQQTLKRATRKADSLRRTLQESGIIYIGSEE